MTTHNHRSRSVWLSEGRGGGKNLGGSSWNSASAMLSGRRHCPSALSLLNPVMGLARLSSAFCSPIWSRVNHLVVCVIGKWYVGGARCCLNWYSYFMHTTGLLLRWVAAFPTSLCPGEVLHVAKGQEITSCHFYWSCWHHMIIAIFENSRSISVPFTLKSLFPRQTMWTW